MDNEARGEVTAPIVLQDEDGQAFAFLPVRVIRDGADLFLLAERELHSHMEKPGKKNRSAS